MTFAVLATASLVKLLLISGQHVSVIGNAGFDDQLFVSQAFYLLHGLYLGTYTNVTLIKGPFYPIYLALMHIAHIPLLLSQQIFYIIACLVFLICVWPLVKRLRKADRFRRVPYVVISFLGLLLIFNPMTSDIQSGTRVIREGIYPALTLLTISLFIALLTYRKASLWKYILISIGAGLSLSAFWLTREEGIWIIPCVVGLTVYSAALIVWKWYQTLDFYRPPPPDQVHRSGWMKRIVILVISFVILWLSISTFSFVNYREYGVKNTVELKTPQFLAAYSSLTRVTSDRWMPVIPVSAHNRQLIYEVSPAFSELKRFLEGTTGWWWANVSEQIYPQYKGEIAGGWFMWALRDAVSRVGYYTSGQKAMSYYARLASEVNAACDRGELPCVKTTNNLYPPLDHRYIGPFVSSFANSFLFLLTFKQYNPVPADVTGDKNSPELFPYVIRQPATNIYGHTRVALLRVTGVLYQIFFPLLTCLSLISYALLLFLKRSYKDPLFIVTGLIGVAIVVRMGLLALTTATSFPAVNTLYLSSAYPLLIIFDVLSLVLICKWFSTRSRKTVEAA